MVYGEFSDYEEKSMHDTSYLNKGQNIGKYLTPGLIQIQERAKQVT
jgi:hypothetical protein